MNITGALNELAWMFGFAKLLIFKTSFESTILYDKAQRADAVEMSLVGYQMCWGG